MAAGNLTAFFFVAELSLSLYACFNFFIQTPFINSETGFFAALTLITLLIEVRLYVEIVLGFRRFLINVSYISALRMILG